MLKIVEPKEEKNYGFHTDRFAEDPPKATRYIMIEREKVDPLFNRELKSTQDVVDAIYSELQMNHPIHAVNAEEIKDDPLLLQCVILALNKYHYWIRKEFNTSLEEEG